MVTAWYQKEQGDARVIEEHFHLDIDYDRFANMLPQMMRYAAWQLKADNITFEHSERSRNYKLDPSPTIERNDDQCILTWDGEISNQAIFSVRSKNQKVRPVIQMVLRPKDVTDAKIDDVFRLACDAPSIYSGPLRIIDVSATCFDTNFEPYLYRLAVAFKETSFDRQKQTEERLKKLQGEMSKLEKTLDDGIYQVTFTEPEITGGGDPLQILLVKNNKPDLTPAENTKQQDLTAESRRLTLSGTPLNFAMAIETFNHRYGNLEKYFLIDDRYLIGENPPASKGRDSAKVTVSALLNKGGAQVDMTARLIANDRSEVTAIPVSGAAWSQFDDLWNMLTDFFREIGIISDTPASGKPAVSHAAQKSSEPQATLSSTDVLIFTEGPSDWKHLKAAWHCLQNQGLFPNLQVTFQEDEQSMGDKELLSLCRAYSRSPQPRPTICVFDRDVSDTLRHITQAGLDYKAWGNRVYSVALPVPPHRQETPDICIEFYYLDEDITRKDSDGRRLFIGTEFHPRALNHITERLNCADRNKAGKSTIIDSQIYSHDCPDENVALSKNAFANYVLNGTPNFDNFDVSAFIALFELIEELAAME